MLVRRDGKKVRLKGEFWWNMILGDLTVYTLPQCKNVMTYATALRLLIIKIKHIINMQGLIFLRGTVTDQSTQ